MTRISKKEQNVDEAKRAIYFYQKYIEEFPSGKYTKIVQLRLNFIKEVIEVDNIYGSLLNIASEEYYIVQQKFKYLFEILLKYSQPNPLKVFTESEIEQNTQQLLINYLDEIIVNYPNYELPSTYLKILVKLQPLTGVEYISSNYLSYDYKKIEKSAYEYAGDSRISMEYRSAKQELNIKLNTLSEKFPKEELVLELHLIFADAFITRNKDDEIDNETLKHFEYILENDGDKLGLRYMLTKDFILNNKFEISGDSKKTK